MRPHDTPHAPPPSLGYFPTPTSTCSSYMARQTPLILHLPPSHLQPRIPLMPRSAPPPPPFPCPPFPSPSPFPPPFYIHPNLPPFFQSCNFLSSTLSRPPVLIHSSYPAPTPLLCISSSRFLRPPYPKPRPSLPLRPLTFTTSQPPGPPISVPTPFSPLKLSPDLYSSRSLRQSVTPYKPLMPLPLGPLIFFRRVSRS